MMRYYFILLVVNTICNFCSRRLQSAYFAHPKGYGYYCDV